MPFTQDDLDRMPIAFEHAGQVSVFTSSCSSTSWLGETIPLDGRRYQLAGRVIFRNGRELFANLRLSTDRPVVLEWDEVFCLVGDKWYGLDEPWLYDALGLSRDQALPLTWVPDRPLDHRDRGPYPADWSPAFGGHRLWWRLW